MTTPKFARGGTAALDVNFREFTSGPFVDPADARFDILDPSNVQQASDLPTSIITVPGRHRGSWPIPVGSALGVWTMRFKATIDSAAVQTDCPFEVVPAGSIEPASDTTFGPCDSWPLDESCCVMPDDATDEMIERWRWVSTELLWAASGRIWGPCNRTVRPCSTECASVFRVSPIFAPIFATSWLLFGGDCSVSEIPLEGPVSDVTDVMVGTTTLLKGVDWRLDRVGEGARLVRPNGEAWPDWQDLGAECGEADTFCVTYSQGIPLSQAALAAHAELTCELVKACIPDCECRLPANVTAQTRQGVTQTFAAGTAWIMNLPLVAAWLGASNPSNLLRKMRVVSPDRPGARRV